MSEAALHKAAIEAFGGAVRGIEAVLLPKNRHGDVDLRGIADTVIWVSDFGPETDTESRFGERLLTALSPLNLWRSSSGRDMLFLYSSQVRAA